jgi:hypothetical protein
VTNFIPPVIAAPLSYQLNRDMFTGRDVYEGRKPVSPSQEYSLETNPALVKIGKAFNMSPMRLQVAAKEILPFNFYTYATGAGIGKILESLPEKERDKVAHQTYTELITQLPFVRKFIRTTYPQKGLDEDQWAKVNKYGIDIFTKSGQPIPVSVIKYKIYQSDMKANDIRNEDDRLIELYRQQLENKSGGAEETNKKLQENARELLKIAPPIGKSGINLRGAEAYRIANKKMNERKAEIAEKRIQQRLQTPPQTPEQE